MKNDVLISGSKGKGGGSYRAAVEDPNTLQSRSIANLVDVLCEGEILGLEGYVEGMPGKGIYFNDTPLITSDGVTTYPDVTLDIRYGTPEQDPLLQDAVQSEVEVSVEVTHDYPKASGSGSGEVSRSITNPNATSARVKIQVAGLTTQDKDTGDLSGGSVSLSIYVNGQFMLSDTIDGKTTSVYQRDYKFPLEGDAPWLITVKRETEDNEDAAINNDLYWSSYTEIVEAKMVYPDTALVAIKGDAETFGNTVPTRKYLVYGMLCKIPSNYNPTSRTYSGLWDGTFKIGWTDNPAWVYYDLLTSERYGVGALVQLTEDTKFDLYTIGQYCDQYVHDGFGGVEPRYTFNYYITSRDEALDVLRAIASVFRGFAFWGAGAVVVRSDMPKDPIRVVTNSNVEGGTFRYSSTPYSGRHSVAIVSWYDPEDMYAVSREVIEDPDLIEKYGWKPLEVTAYGCTSRGQAHRLGRWQLVTEQFENETVNYIAGLDHFDIIPGDIISIDDIRYQNVRRGGRLLPLSLNRVQLDAPIEVSWGTNYYIHITMPDLSIEERKLAVTSSGSFDTFNLLGSLPEMPLDNAEWIITENTNRPRQFRVLNKTEPEPGKFGITALLFNPDKFDEVEAPAPLPPKPPVQPLDDIYPPTDLTVVESLTWMNGLPQSNLTISWTQSRDPRVEGYNVQIVYPNGAKDNRTFNRTCSFDLKNVTKGRYRFRVQSFAVTGKTSSFITKEYEVTGKIDGPDKCTNLAAMGWFGSIWLTWDNPKDTDISYVEVWENPVDDLQTAEKIVEVKGTSYQRVLGSFQGRYYWVRAIDMSGNPGEFNADAGTYGYSDMASHEDFIDALLEDNPLIQELIDDLGTEIDGLSESGIWNSISDFNEAEANAIQQAKIDKIAEMGIQGELSTLQDVTWTLATIQEERVIRETEDEALAQNITVITAMVGDPDNPNEDTVWASIYQEVLARATEDEALALKIDKLTASIGDPNNPGPNTVYATIYQEALVLAKKDEALAKLLERLEASIGDPSNPASGTVYAAIETEQLARVTRDSALASQINTLGASIGDPRNPGQGTVFAAIKDESNARASADASLASKTTTLESNLNGQSVKIQQNSTAIDGIKGEWTVKIDANGHVAGLGLMNGPTGSVFAVRADSFWVTQPGTPIGDTPFVIGTVDGITRVSMKNAFIQDAAISSAKIKDLTVGRLKIAGGQGIGLSYANTINGKFNGSILSTPLYFAADPMDKGGRVVVTASATVFAYKNSFSQATIEYSTDGANWYQLCLIGWWKMGDNLWTRSSNTGSGVIEPTRDGTRFWFRVRIYPQYGDCTPELFSITAIGIYK